MFKWLTPIFYKEMHINTKMLFVDKTALAKWSYLTLVRVADRII